MKLFDSHTHIDFEAFDEDRDAVLERLHECGVAEFLNITSALSPEHAERTHALALRTPGMWMSVGVHPHDAEKMDEGALEFMRTFLSRERVRAVGEIGLDYFYENASRPQQIKWFEAQLELALLASKPVSIHSRDAFDDTRAILRAHDACARVGVILHCFTGSAEEARTFLDLGAYISFSGIVTFKKAQSVRDAALSVPLDRLLIETDAPYLAPEPHRGKRNEPAYVLEVARHMAALRNLPIEELARVTFENAERVLLSRSTG